MIFNFNYFQAMVILKSSNRILTSVEKENSLNSISNNKIILGEVIKKFRFSKRFLWKMRDMNILKCLINKERQDLKNIVWICVFKHRQVIQNKDSTKRFENSLIYFFKKYQFLKRKFSFLYTFVITLEENIKLSAKLLIEK